MKEERGLSIYRNCPPVVDVKYDKNGDETVVEALVDALAAADGVPATELSPLYDTVDTTALIQLFDEHEGAAEAEAVLSFRFETWNVFVRADGRIRVCDGTRVTDPAPVFGESRS